MLNFKTLALIVLLALMLDMTNNTVAQVLPQIPISVSVHGSFVFVGKLADGSRGTRLLSVDTYTGLVESFHQYDGAIESPVWDATGTRVAYLKYPVSYSVFDTSTNQLNELNIPGAETAFFQPQSWSADDTQILYSSAQFDLQQNSHLDKLEIMNTADSSRTALLTYENDQVLNSIPLPPLPPEVTQLTYQSIVQADWNPVYPDWIVLQLSGHTDEVTLSDIGQGTTFHPTLLFNRQTGAMISLDQFLGKNIYTNPIRWSPSGKLLFARTEDAINIIGFDVSSGTPNLTLIHTSETENTVILDWLGAGDLLLGGITDADSNDAIYYLAEIVNQNWNQVEFFRLPNTDVPLVSSGDWYIRASDQEKQTLTCLFDQALPTRLAIGTRARVNFTTGTPLRLRAEPNLDSAEIQQMPEGTEFDVVGGSACVNSDSYYRFWQVRLDDGTTSWAAEADNTDYFIRLARGNLPSMR